MSDIFHYNILMYIKRLLRKILSSRSLLFLINIEFKKHHSKLPFRILFQIRIQLYLFRRKRLQIVFNTKVTT